MFEAHQDIGSLVFLDPNILDALLTMRVTLAKVLLKPEVMLPSDPRFLGSLHARVRGEATRLEVSKSWAGS